MSVLDGKPKTYQKFAEEYYERMVDPGSVTAIYEHRPLTSEIIQKLNPAVTLKKLRKDVAEIDYPLED